MSLINSQIRGKKEINNKRYETPSRKRETESSDIIDLVNKGKNLWDKVNRFYREPAKLGFTHLG